MKQRKRKELCSLCKKVNTVSRLTLALRKGTSQRQPCFCIYCDKMMRVTTRAAIANGLYSSRHPRKSRFFGSKGVPNKPPVAVVLDEINSQDLLGVSTNAK